jgi:HK97 family phage major capsid protein
MEQLQKALLQSTGDGVHLAPQDLNPMLMEYLGRLSPLYGMIAKKQAEGRTHEYTARTALPGAWFEGEVTTPAPAASGYTRKSVQLKILRIAGGVSGFQQAVSQKFIDALESEIIGSLEGFANMLEWSTVYGDAAADPYQFSGLDANIRSDATASKAVSAGGNILDVGGVIDLSALDTMIDVAHATRAADRDPKVFLMSQQMISKVSGLQTRVNREVPMIEFEGGFRFASYRGVPIVPSSYVRPSGVTTSPNIAAAKAAGGALADATYHYRIASVTDLGEQLIGGTANATTETTNNTVNLTWTADANAKQYKIYRGAAATAADMALLDVIAAKTYNGEGAVSGTVAAYADAGAKTPNTAIKPLSTGEEQLMLVNTSDVRGLQFVGMMSPLGEQTSTFVTYIPLATRKSAFEYMIEAFMAAMVPYPTLHVVARRAKLA